MRFVSESEDDTLVVAAKIAAASRPGDIYALKGELGAGKTVFSRGFARALGVVEPVCSPTFTIVQEYSVTRLDKSSLKRLYHMDVYRIQDSSAAFAFGIEDFLNDEDAIKLIEWPERIEDILPTETVRIEIEHLAENRREIVVYGFKD
ncbi:MAG: tRNA (adenosine(37)-N6)-threonylcarbamoyltransferase complex ATPase subunit type 1 TsaE [Victivallales bacterium]|nr:tRNA (adenosine(37)-N6)-threonylcarbamoyltransferase complex ATPase subunit type 1 TsaE [Victivallales bacterium]